MLDLSFGGKCRLNADGQRLMRELNKLNEMRSFVGFEGDKTYPDGTPVASVAAHNEFGDSRTPARPFMKQSLERNKSQLTSFLGDVISAVANGEETAEGGLDLIGQLGKEYIQDTIENGDFVSNSPYTVAQKGSDRPLIDTGLMRDSVTYKTGRKE